MDSKQLNEVLTYMDGSKEPDADGLLRCLQVVFGHMEDLSDRNVAIDAAMEERNEADTHYLIMICHALGLRKAQSVPLALEAITDLQAEVERLRQTRRNNNSG